MTRCGESIRHTRAGCRLDLRLSERMTIQFIFNWSGWKSLHYTLHELLFTFLKHCFIPGCRTTSILSAKGVMRDGRRRNTAGFLTVLHTLEWDATGTWEVFCPSVSG